LPQNQFIYDCDQGVHAGCAGAKAAGSFSIQPLSRACARA